MKRNDCNCNNRRRHLTALFYFKNPTKKSKKVHSELKWSNLKNHWISDLRFKQNPKIRKNPKMVVSIQVDFPY